MQRVKAHRDMSHGLPVAPDQILTSGLTLHGVVLASNSVTIDDAMGRQMISLFVHTLARIP